MPDGPAAVTHALDALGQSLLHHLAADQLNVLLVRHGQPGPGRMVDGLLGKPLTTLEAIPDRSGGRLAQAVEGCADAAV